MSLRKQSGNQLKTVGLRAINESTGDFVRAAKRLEYFISSDGPEAIVKIFERRLNGRESAGLVSKGGSDDTHVYFLMTVSAVSQRSLIPNAACIYSVATNS